MKLEANACNKLTIVLEHVPCTFDANETKNTNSFSVQELETHIGCGCGFWRTLRGHGAFPCPNSMLIVIAKLGAAHYV